MCEKCAELDKKIAHYERLASSILDQLTVGGIDELIDEMKVEKDALHPNRKWTRNQPQLEPLAVW